MVFPTARLSDFAQVFSGYAFKSSDLGSSGLPVLKIANIQDTLVLTNCRDHFPDKKMTKRLEKFILRPEDILVAMTGAGSVGKFGRLRRIDRTYLVNQRVGIIRVDT